MAGKSKRKQGGGTMGMRLQALPKRKSAVQSWSGACAFAHMRPWKGGMADSTSSGSGC